MKYPDILLGFLKVVMPIVNTAAMAGVTAAQAAGAHVPTWIFITAAVVNALAIYGGTNGVQNRLEDDRASK